MNTALPASPLDVLESKTNKKRITNVASVPQLSPFRYPGGKTWLVPEIRAWLQGLNYRPRLFIEPFAGGAIASLTAVMENWAERAILCELDDQVAAVWETIFEDGEWLIDQILSFVPTLDNVHALLEQQPVDRKYLGFQTLVRNRTQRGGILAPGASLLRRGENGKGVASRWYPETLAKRIRRIQEYRARLRFIHGDGFRVIEEHCNDHTCAFFVDPPYTAGGKQPGKRLYTHNDVDHERLFELMAGVRGEFLMTYNNTLQVVDMARRYGFKVSQVLMRNTNHAETYELLIANQ